MRSEFIFVSTLIATAEQRVARQNTLIGALEAASDFKQVDAARRTLQVMLARLEKLHRGRATLDGSYVLQVRSDRSAS